MVRSIVIIFKGNDCIDFVKELLNFFINVSDVLSVSFVLSFIIPLFVSIFVFGTKLAINFGLLSTFLFTKELFNGGNGTGNGLPVFEDVIEFGVRGKFNIGFSGVL